MLALIWPDSITLSACWETVRKGTFFAKEVLTAIFIALFLQIAAMLKDNEKIQSNPTTAPSDDDSEIKKIKKVRHWF